MPMLLSNAANLILLDNPNHDEHGRFAEGDGAGGRAAVRSQRAKSGDLHPATKVGTGKDSKIQMEDGSEAPAHIKAAMIPPAYRHNLQVSKDRNADVWATSEDEDGNSKRVYNPRFLQSNQDVKWNRVGEGVDKIGNIRNQIQADRNAGRNVNEADAAWLMSEQATRPGSESDTKGNKALWEQPIDKSNVSMTPAKDGKGPPKVSINVGGQTVPIRDEGAREEISNRIAGGKPLENAGYWLKSHGATTLEGRHVVPDGNGGAKLQFMGKEGVWHDHQVQDPALAKMLLARKSQAGDRGSLFKTDYNSVAKYVGKLGGGNFSPKDLRTIRANEMARQIVGDTPVSVGSEKERQAYINGVGDKVSRVLGNRRQQALESYIDPTTFDKVKVWPAKLSNSETSRNATGAIIRLSRQRRMRQTNQRMPAPPMPISPSRSLASILLSQTGKVIDVGGGDHAELSHGVWTSSDTDLAALLNHRATQTGLTDDDALLADAKSYLGLNDAVPLLSRAANAIYLGGRPDQMRDEKGRFVAEGGTPVNTAHPRLAGMTKQIRGLERARRKEISNTPEHKAIDDKIKELRAGRRGEWRKVLDEEKAAVAAKAEAIEAAGRAARHAEYQKHGQISDPGKHLNPIGPHVSRLNEEPSKITGDYSSHYLPNQPNASHDPFDAFNAAVEEHAAASANPTTPNAPALQSEAAQAVTIPPSPTEPNSEPAPPSSGDAPKEPWQMSFKEYQAAGHKGYIQGHRYVVTQAIKEGKDVPAEAINSHAPTIDAAARKKLDDEFGGNHLQKLREAASQVKNIADASDKGNGKLIVRRQQTGPYSFQNLEKGNIIKVGGSPKIVTKANKPYVGRGDGGVHGYYQEVQTRDPKDGEVDRAMTASDAILKGQTAGNNMDYPDLKQKQMAEYSALVHKALGPQSLSRLLSRSAQLICI